MTEASHPSPESLMNVERQFFITIAKVADCLSLRTFKYKNSKSDPYRIAIVLM